MFECTYSFYSLTFRKQSTFIIRVHITYNDTYWERSYHFWAKKKFFYAHRSKKVKAVDLVFLSCSFLTFMLPCWVNVANLFCHIPSTTYIASCSPVFTQSMIWILMLGYPHLAKCLPSGVLSSSISRRCPACLLCMSSVVLPTY